MPVQVIEAGARRSGSPANITVIPQVEEAPRKKRTAYYVRVSTDSEAQQGSNDNMVEHFENLIKNDPTMEFVGGYVDTGISGTSLKNRRAFNQMMEDCKAGLIDRVLTKSISRWARNTLISIQTIRQLKDLGVSVYFEKENLESMDDKSEIVFTLLASIAQSESQSIAANISMGLHYKFAQGVQMVNCSYFLGYTKDPITKELVIEPSEARVVRFIYRAYLEGFSVPEIAKKLREWGIRTGSGKTSWPVETVRYILSNERYMGHAILQKTYTKDFLSHKSVKNTGQLPQYYLTDCHPPIVPEVVFRLVQRELMRREEGGHPGQRKYELSGKVICGRCGSEYKRFTRPAATTTAADNATTTSSAEGTPTTTSAEATTTATTAETSVVTAGSVETRTDAERSTDSAAIWKCKARASAKDAAKARSRIQSSLLTREDTAPSLPSASAAAPLPTAGNTDGSVDNSTDSSTEENSASSSVEPSSVWRCDNHIVSEAKLNAAVERALALLPGEIENIKAIQASCKAVLATSAAPEVALQDSDTVGSARLLLLHTDTALRYLEDGDVSSSAAMQRMAGTAGRAGMRREPGTAGRQGVACKTLDRFIAMTPMVGLDGLGELGEVELLIDRVVIDGDEIKVRFKAGVEI